MTKHTLKLSDYLADGGNYSVRRLDFDTKEEVEFSEPTHIAIKDQVSDVLTNDEELFFSITRTLNMVPSDFLSISITIRVMMRVKEEYHAKVPWDKLKIEKELFEDDGSCIFAPMSTICMLIAEITSAYDSPLIVPPNLLSD